MDQSEGFDITAEEIVTRVAGRRLATVGGSDYAFSCRFIAIVYLCYLLQELFVYVLSTIGICNISLFSLK